MVTYVRVPDNVWMDACLSHSTVRVYQVLAAQARASKSRVCKPIGIRLLARIANCSLSTTQAALEQLKSRGHIEIHAQGRGGRTQYVMASKWFERQAPEKPVKRMKESA